jgi:hypothetical protein
MLDNRDGRATRATGLAINHAVCYVAATPVMFVGEKWFREYPALQDPIEEVRVTVKRFREDIEPLREISEIIEIRCAERTY